MKRKICVVTGTRAEYGLLRWLMKDIKDEEGLSLVVIATGSHLSPEFDLTYREIESDGFEISRKIEMLVSSDSPVGIAKSMGLGMIGFADSFAELRPDVLVVIGDRFEIFAAVAAALVARIPVAHIHGGESTEGAFDEALRHSITKMSHLHFVAAGEYRRRVIQLGEHPDRVFLVGGLGVDAIKRISFLKKEELEASMDFNFGSKNLLVTFHPVTLESESSSKQFGELLEALEELIDTAVIFTMPNADTGGDEITRMIKSFVEKHDFAKSFVSLGQLRYLSCLQYVDGVVGNSSSGLLEAPSMGVGTINIGERQRGRLKASSVIDCLPEKLSIDHAIKKLYSDDFRNLVRSQVAPYGTGGASRRILETLHHYDLSGLVIKPFYDVPSINIDPITS